MKEAIQSDVPTVNDWVNKFEEDDGDSDDERGGVFA